MRMTINRFAAVAVAFIAISLISGCATQRQAVAPSEPARVVPAERLNFTQVAPFVQMATVSGDRETGAHGTFGIFSSGASSPPHTHTGAYHGVVLRGTMTNPFVNESNPPPMGPGSYWFVPAGSQHVTACVSKEPCHFYFYADSAFDFKPIAQ